MGTLVRRGPVNGLGDWPDWNVTTTPPVTTTLSGVWGASDTQVYAVGDGMVILFFDGSTWAKVPTPNITTNLTRKLHAVWGAGANNVYAVGDGGTILHYIQ
jgi:hypothetical protein